MKSHIIVRTKTLLAQHLILVALLGAAVHTRAASTPPTPCLAISPLRALPSAHEDSAASLLWRDRLIDSLQKRLSNHGWRVAPAGSCGQSPTLDAFQSTEDFVVDGSDTTARLRLEWHDQPGAVILFLDSPQNPEQFLGLWANQIATSSRAHMAHINLTITPNQSALQISQHAYQWNVPVAERANLELPPGRWSLLAENPGFHSHTIDTLLQAGQDIPLSFQLLPIPQDQHRLKSWPFWVASGASLGAGAWFAFQQMRAQDQYSRLDSTASATTFESRWNTLRNANLARNWLIGASLGFGCIAAYLQF